MSKFDEANNVRNNAAARIKEIQSDRDLTAQAKAKRIAEIRQTANETLKTLRGEYEKERSERASGLKRQLFGLSFKSTATDADRHLARMNYRDAMFRTDSLKDAREAERLFTRAQTAGDKELMKAIAAKAYETGWGNILDSYAGESPDIASGLEELVGTERDGNSQSRFATSMQFTQIAETPEEREVRMTTPAMAE